MVKLTTNPARDVAGATLQIHLSSHAAEAMQLRGLDPAWIAATVTDPDWTEPDPRPERMRSYKAIAAFGGRVLRVVHRPAADGVMVITAHFDRGARR